MADPSRGSLPGRSVGVTLTTTAPADLYWSAGTKIVKATDPNAASLSGTIVVTESAAVLSLEAEGDEVYWMLEDGRVRGLKGANPPVDVARTTEKPKNDQNWFRGIAVTQKFVYFLDRGADEVRRVPRLGLSP